MDLFYDNTKKRVFAYKNENWDDEIKMYLFLS